MSENLCSACPRMCRCDRTKYAGYCKSGPLPSIARAAPHFGEEPCISAARGSGAVFFRGCNLRCVFCQNREISRGGRGGEVSAEDMRNILLRLRDSGVHNINLVTPSHYADFLAGVLRGLELGIPVVWNSSGYDSVGSLAMLEGLVQIYMPDMKYADGALAGRYSNAPDYPERAKEAILEMYRQTGPFRLDGDGVMASGVLIRHLMLPGEVQNTLSVIDWVSDTFPAGSVMFSLMSQYTPIPGLEAYPQLCRTITEEEYSRAKSYLELSGITDGYLQDFDSAGEDYIPDFDGSGVN